MNIVILKHSNDGRQLLFGVPEGKTLKKDDKVLVENCNGLVDAICTCDSFEAAENIVAAMQQMFGEKFPLAMVVGRYSLEKWDEAKQEAGESVL